MSGLIESKLKEVGYRLKEHRLQQNITRKDLAEKTGLTYTTIANIETGNDARLKSVIAILNELGLINQVEVFVPPVERRPTEIIETEGKVRKRASSKRETKSSIKKNWQWGDL